MSSQDFDARKIWVKCVEVYNGSQRTGHRDTNGVYIKNIFTNAHIRSREETTNCKMAQNQPP